MFLIQQPEFITEQFIGVLRRTDCRRLHFRFLDVTETDRKRREQLLGFLLRHALDLTEVAHRRLRQRPERRIYVGQPSGRLVRVATPAPDLEQPGDRGFNTSVEHHGHSFTNFRFIHRKRGDTPCRSSVSTSGRIGRPTTL